MAFVGSGGDKYGGGEDVRSLVEGVIHNNVSAIFSKTFCPFSRRVKAYFDDLGYKYEVMELDQMGEMGKKVQDYLMERTGQGTVPNVFVQGVHIGGFDDTLKAGAKGELFAALGGTGSVGTVVMGDQEEKLSSVIGSHNFDYDVIVIGGGSGGLAASKECARLGLKTAVYDFVKPTPIGTSWGLGGTCVNVGCIPKKLMHQASLLEEGIKDSQHYGWKVTQGEAAGGHNWNLMVENIQNHVQSLNWGYKVQLRSKKVDYKNEYATFVGPNKLETVNKKGVKKEVTASHFILATGGRPRYPNIPFAKELAITSDDIFSLPYHPGKTLLIGASYIALETAGFLHGLGIDVTIMVRSILLRGFDQQMAEMIGAIMEKEGVKFIRSCVPTKLEQLNDGKPGKVRVYGKYNDGELYSDEYNTVIFAIGRDAETSQIGLDTIGIDVNPKNGKVIVNNEEQTSVSHVYAVGDILDGKLELTPVAIQAGKLLARRLAGDTRTLTDYKNVPTTVFTPVEYSCCGLSEEEALEVYGASDLEVFHTNLWPLEWTVAKRAENICYAKMICVKSRRYRVVGLHYLGPNAGEVMQGFAGMIKLKATKDDFDNLIGIHPTNAEVFTTMNISKTSGDDPSTTGC